MKHTHIIIAALLLVPLAALHIGRT